MFKIINGEKLSFHDVIEFQKSGKSVMRTAHLGNLTHSIIFLGLNRILVLLHEYLPAGISLYKPGYIKLLDKQINLSGQACFKNRLIQITHIAKNKIPPEILSSLNINLENIHNVAQLHYESVVKISKSFVLYSDFVLENLDNSIKIVGALSKEFPELFNTYFDSKGKEYKYFKTQHDLLFFKDKNDNEVIIKKSDLLQLTFDFINQTKNRTRGDNDYFASGIMMSTSPYILLFTLLDIINKKNKNLNFEYTDVDVIHLAGLKMMDYMIYDKELAKINTNQLQAMFSYLRSIYPDLIPKNINFILMPTDWINQIISCDKGAIDVYEKYLANRKKIPPESLHKETKYQYDLLINPVVPMLPKSAWKMSQLEIKACFE